MNHTIKLPLTLHFLSSSHAKAIESLVSAYITEYRLNNRHPVTVDKFAFFAIYSMFHPVGVARGLFVFYDKRNLSPMAFTGVCGGWILHALVFYCAVSAFRQATLKKEFMVTILIDTFPV